MFVLYISSQALSPVIAGPCKPSPPSSSTDQAGYASTAPKYEIYSTASVAIPATGYQNPEVAEPHELPKFSFPRIPSVSPGCRSSPETREDKEPDDEDEDKSSKMTCTDITTASDCLNAPQLVRGHNQDGCSVSGITTTTSAKDCSATEIGGSCTTCQKDVFFVNDNKEVEFIEMNDEF
ncbi:hypothetical protein FVEN_g13163 [Fusarium venenatum]|nr:hypothetical protein FVEN_g13163 [Fusarium venenatum]